MFSLLLALLIIWLFWKLGIGMLKIVGFLIIVGLLFAFVSYLVLPLLALIALGGLIGLIFAHYSQQPFGCFFASIFFDFTIYLL